jgi:hypothetical protein
VHDFERADGGRAVVALHGRTAGPDGHGAVGATVLDALDPDTAKSSFYPGLLFGGIQ